MVPAKKELRRALLAVRRNSAPMDRARWSEKIVACLLQQEAFQQAKLVMAYLAMTDEVNLDTLIDQAVAMGKTVLLPRIGSEPHSMEAVRFTDWKTCPPVGAFGIRTPAGQLEPLDPAAIDLILVPGLAYDRQGWRLGMGGGYYDRFLPRAAGAVKIGVCTEALLLPSVPHEAHDQKVDQVVTERSCYFAG